MINLAEQTIGIDGPQLGIKRWEVYFQTPFGLFTNLTEAIERMKANDLDPNLMILPVAVAISDEEYEVVYPRG